MEYQSLNDSKVHVVTHNKSVIVLYRGMANCNNENISKICIFF